MRLLWIPALLIGLLSAGSFAVADDEVITRKLTAHQQREDTLDGLFATLQRAPGEAEAKQAEQKIWEIWAQSDSVTADVLLNQAVAAMNAGDNRASFGILNQVIATYPEYAEAWNKRATLNFMIGRYYDSLADIEKVLELEPRHFGALSGRGMIYQTQEKWGPALEAYREALKINPNLASVKEAIKQLEKRERDL